MQQAHSFRASYRGRPIGRSEGLTWARPTVRMVLDNLQHPGSPGPCRTLHEPSHHLRALPDVG